MWPAASQVPHHSPARSVDVLVPMEVRRWGLSLGAGLTRGRELPVLGAKNQTLVLSKSSKHSATQPPLSPETESLMGFGVAMGFPMEEPPKELLTVF